MARFLLLFTPKNGSLKFAIKVIKNIIKLKGQYNTKKNNQNLIPIESEEINYSVIFKRAITI
jgi:hypothetical protein